MNIRIFSTTVTFLFISACADSNNGISEQIQTQFNASSTGPINLALVGPSSWERVCVLGPYTMNDHAEKILGFKWDATGKTSIGSNDGIYVLTFVKGNEVIAYTEHPRNKGDFMKMKPRCLNREQANLVRQSDNDGCVFLVTNQQAIIQR
ncbi:hypothetical protein [Sulfurirhabdus autotrophica]|uniref:Lipoprotein n=1 Tax=Sulfurirhabdus autotrophica TaxID=1706046 RepID=A0A4R3Y114_9PROT|nr:hypothetical protein [Sulfurirhabdus autotrophica]TCV85112.1 hypothetical protein EDC63_1101 [Sulfurirhabdus autotrophica]